MKKTLVVKKRWIVGRTSRKRHGPIVGEGFKLNPPEVISVDIQEQIGEADQIQEGNWRWWQLSDELIIEKSPTDTDFGSSFTAYYLPLRRWKVVQQRGLYFGEEIEWFVHIADIDYESTYGCWLVTDLFTDVIIRRDRRTHSVLDLDDLAEVFEAGLINEHLLVQILRDTQALIDLIRSGDFPPGEIEECRRLWIESRQLHGLDGR